MKKWILLAVILANMGLAYCQEIDQVKHPTLEELVILPEKKIPWGGLTCEECHFDHQKMTEFEGYGSYVDKNEYRQTKHGNLSIINITCEDCHLLDIYVITGNGKESINWAGYCPPPRVIGGFGSNTTYHTVPAEGCVNKSRGCHRGRENFFSGEHFILEGIRSDERSWNVSNKEYRPWYCIGCHLVCSTCHWEGPIPKEEEDFKFDFLDNVKSHRFETEIPSERCAICHKGSYKNIEGSDEVELSGHPQYQEWKVSVHNGTPCKDCHRNIHGAQYTSGEYGKRSGPTSCGTCHRDVIKSVESGPHIDVACYSCHSLWLPLWQDPESLTTEPYAIRHERQVTWPTHEIRPIKETRICEYCHGNTTIQEKYSRDRNDVFESMDNALRDAVGARATALLTSAEIKHLEAKAAWAHVSPDKETLANETIALAKEAKRTADMTNFIGFLAYIAVTLAILGVILVIWPYE